MISSFFLSRILSAACQRSRGGGGVYAESRFWACYYYHDGFGASSFDAVHP